MTEATVKSKELNCFGFTMGHAMLCPDSSSVLLTLGTKKGYALFTQADPKFEACAIENCLIAEDPQSYKDKRYDCWVWCNFCRDWKHMLCLKMTFSRYTTIQKSNEKFRWKKGRCNVTSNVMED